MTALQNVIKLLQTIIWNQSSVSTVHRIKMLKFVVLVALVGAAAAQLQKARPRSGTDADIQIVKQSLENDGQGTYNYFYENSDGSAASQQGSLKPAQGTAEPAQEVSGFYTYPAPDGTLVRVDYISNENGFQPRGDHLPTPPPIPDYILRSLEYIRSAQGRPAEPAYRPAEPAFRPAPQPFRPAPQPAFRPAPQPFRPAQPFRG